MSYSHRIADLQLAERLEAFGAVLIEGPKWCGKTTTAEQMSKSVIKMQDTEMQEEYAATAASKPSLLLMGETPRLIDEWQDAPVLWDAVRTMVDKRQVPGQFILTGSTVVDRSKIHHSGTGRISRMKMLPMSLWESGQSNGKISLKELFDNKDLDIDGITSDMKIEDLIYAACRGGWPAFLNMKSDKAKLLIARNYVDAICRDDISRVDGVQRDERTTRAIRVSMGTVFQVPWAYFPKYNVGSDNTFSDASLHDKCDSRDKNCSDRNSSVYKYNIDVLHKLGFKTCAMALTDDSVSIDDPVLHSEERLAIVLGTEGDGLHEQTIDSCDYTVKIPMSHGVDSLNVAAASAVAFWELAK